MAESPTVAVSAAVTVTVSVAESVSVSVSESGAGFVSVSGAGSVSVVKSETGFVPLTVTESVTVAVSGSVSVPPVPRALPRNRLLAHELALEAAGQALALVAGLSGPYRSLGDQVIRSASSVPANLAEGQGRRGRDRRHFYRIAYASARELDSHLRLLAAAGAIDPAGTAEALDLLDRARALTWRLVEKEP